jgi:hypothetical protein
MTSTENPQASSCIRISEPHTFKAAHRPQSRLQASVIGFDRIVCILLGDVARGGYQLLDHLRIPVSLIIFAGSWVWRYG